MTQVAAKATAAAVRVARAVRMRAHKSIVSPPRRHK